jgi:hypothetical protein
LGISSTGAVPYKFLLPDDSEFEVFLPHESVPFLVGEDQDQWCVTDEQGTAEKGLGPLLHEWARHPDVNLPPDADPHKVVVLGFHSDGVQYTSSMRAGGAKSVVVGSLNIVSAQAQENRAHRIPLFVIRKGRLCKCGCGGYCTYQRICEVLSWSFRCLALGKLPTSRHDGAPWNPYDAKVRMHGSDITRGALLQVRGDWEGLVSFFRLRFYKSENFCWMCNCTMSPGDLCYKNFQLDAPHRSTLITHQQYLLNCATTGDQPSNLFRSPGFTLKHIVVDSMHAADLGTFCDALGSLFWIEITNRHWYPNQKAGLAGLNRQLNQYYKANANQKLSRITPIVLSQIISRDPGYPYLKGKAAQVRHLAEFGLALANRHRHGGGGYAPFLFGQRHRLRQYREEHADLLVKLFEGMTKYLRSISATDFDEEHCKEGMFTYLQSMECLNTLWRRDLTEAQSRPQPFHLRPKTHVLTHCVLDHTSIYGSPSQFWCYRDEDFVGAVKNISAKTKHPKTLEVRVMQKLKILKGLGFAV